MSPLAEIVDSLLQKSLNTGFSRLDQKLAQLQQLNDIWQATVDNHLAQHTRVANFRTGQLIIEVDNAIWASRLRYLVPNLCQALVTYPAMATLQNISWYLRPNHTPIPINRSGKKLLALSQMSSQLLQATAATVSSTILQKALRRLARHSNPTP